MSDTNRNQNLEFNILGCVVRVKTDEQNNMNAKKAVEVLNDEIQSLKTKNPSLKDIDLAVLSALKIASSNLDLEAEYKENVLALRSGIEDALNFVEDISAKETSTTL